MNPDNRELTEFDHDGFDRDHFGHKDVRSGDTSHDAVDRVPAAAGGTPPAGLPQPPGQVRTVRLVAGEYLVTVNPLDGSEIEPCPPGERPDPPARADAEERDALRRAALPPEPVAPARPMPSPAERDEARERLGRLLGRGRSVRVTGLPGSGRTTLLRSVAADCADIAPDGVVHLSGYHRTATDLLYELFAVVHRAPLHRPGRAAMLAAVAEIGAVVVLDDIEFGGSALDELLSATPECAFLISATPDVPALSGDAHIEEVFLGGFSRAACVEFLEHAAGRPLDGDERAWAADLWFESEGLPLRCVQAAALLRQRDALRAGVEAVHEDGVFAERVRDARARDAGSGELPVAAGNEDDVPLPALAEAAAPAALLASRLSEAARETLRFAVALGGECPHQAHLPALTGDSHADAAVGELLDCGLLTPVRAHYRLAAGVATQLEAAGYGEGAADRALTAARHYAWWAGHRVVTPERATAESDAMLAAMAALVAAGNAGSTAGAGNAGGSGNVGGSRNAGGSGSAAHAGDAGDTEKPSAAVRLARTASPVFAADLRWGAWERALRHGQEAARLSGEVAEEAYFHHELGVLALCTGQVDRARAELEASIALRGALSDRRGTVAGRRALALVADTVMGLTVSGTGMGAGAGAGPEASTAGTSGTGPSAVGTRPARPGGPVGAGAPGAGAGAGLAGAGQAALGAEGAGRTTAGPPQARTEPTASPPGGVRAAATAHPSPPGGPFGQDAADETITISNGPGTPADPHEPPFGQDSRARRTGFRGGRRNAVAAAAGALLVAVLGTVATLGMGAGDTDGKGDRVKSEQSTPDDTDSGLPADEQPAKNATKRSHKPDEQPAPATTDRPAGSGDAPAKAPVRTGEPSASTGPSDEPSQTPTSKPPSTPSDKPSDEPSSPGSHSPSPKPTPTPTRSPILPGTSAKAASGPAPNGTAGASGTDSGTGPVA